MDSSSSQHSSTTGGGNNNNNDGGTPRTVTRRGAAASAPQAPEGASSAAGAATASLQLLLREDPLLQQYGLTDSTRPTDEVAFPYAAGLLSRDGDASSSSQTQAAQRALQDVERKLALVESLAVKLSRTSPEAVAGPFLRWHGYDGHGGDDGGASSADTASNRSSGNNNSGNNSNTLSTVRDRADRLERQSEVLCGVATRVEGGLQRGLDRMGAACRRLERVLIVSQTLKRLLRFLFEYRKARTYDPDDVRDLTRAAASVAVLEDLLEQPEWRNQPIRALRSHPPAVRRMATTVRQAARRLLTQSTAADDITTATSTTPTTTLAATLQVYFSLQELPAAVWEAVEQQHDHAERATKQLVRAMDHLPSSSHHGGGGNNSARQQRRPSQRARLTAAETWAAAVTAAATRVRRLQRVLRVKTDPHTRRGFWHVVATASRPAEYEDDEDDTTTFSLFGLFWKRYCRTLGRILREHVHHNNNATAAAGAMYPAVRGVAKDMIGRLQEGNATTAVWLEDGGGGTRKSGVLGGSLATTTTEEDYASSWTNTMENPQTPPPDAWTRGDPTTLATTATAGGGGDTASSKTSIWGSAASLAIFQSQEWKDLQGTEKEPHGLYRLQQAFVQACTERLCEPLQYLFPENITLDDHGVPMSGGALSLLPSKYDIQRFDENIRQELSLADPREGGGDLSLVTMICACVVDMMQQFCHRAEQALSGSQQYITAAADWNMTESLQHDRKVAVILYTVANHLKVAPEKTFVTPYRPASLPAHEEAVDLCEGALQPALTAIENTVQDNVLSKLAQSLNQRLATLLAKMHLGVYLGRSEDEESSSSTTFCQRQISPALDTVAERIMMRFPPPYATHLACSVTSFLIYTFCSNMALLRPLSEESRLHITHDLADLELALEQFVSKTAATSLSQVGKGKPYAELRAVRQMLFWNGLSSAGKSGHDLCRMLLRESWIRSVRPSTVLHYLFSYAPTLLTSPHHAQRTKAEDYAQMLVNWDGSSSADGEEEAWMNTLACCDSYQQRSGTSSAASDGDARVAALLLALGPELLRRRRS